MRRSYLLFALLIALAVALSGCSDSKSDAIAMRVAALTYAFDQDPETKQAAHWVFTVDSDLETESVVAALSAYPISTKTLQIEDRSSVLRVDAESGKRYAHWRVKIERKGLGEMWADVGCVKGGLNGYGQILVLKKKHGQWIVVSTTPTWIS